MTPFSVDANGIDEREETMADWRQTITMEPGKRGGRPCIRGMRITVYDVLSYLAAGMSEAEILDDYPYLTSDDIRACREYATDTGKSCEVGTR